MAIYSINKIIRNDKPIKRNGKYPIYLRIRIRYKETKVPTGFDVFAFDWDSKKSQPKCKALQILVNKKVMELDLFLNRCMANEQELSIELVKSFYSGKREIKPEMQSFYSYYLDFVDRKRKEGLNPETIRVYMTTYKVMKEFKSDFRINDISLELIEKFDEHMRDVNGNSSGGRNPKHKNLRTVILDIVKRNIPVDNPYKWFKMPTSETKEVYLKRSELNLLEKYAKTLPVNSRDRNILQMYLFSCYCGLRFSDVLDLEWRHIDFENSLIRKNMVKTKSEVITPIFTMAQEILLERLQIAGAIKNEDKVFEKMTEPTVNKNLRKCVKLAGIEKYLSYHSSRQIKSS